MAQAKPPADKPKARALVRAGREGLSKPQILAAALRYIDEHGLRDFGVRTMARELGVFPTTIMWHMQSRGAFMADVVAYALRDLDLGDATAPWTDWVRSFAHQMRARVRRHPHIAPLVGSQLMSDGVANLDVVEALAATLSRAGFKGDRLVDAYNAIVAAVVGYISLELAVLPEEGAGEWAAEFRAGLQALDPARHPTLAANADRFVNQAFAVRWKGGQEQPLDRSYDALIDALLVGLSPG